MKDPHSKRLVVANGQPPEQGIRIQPPHADNEDDLAVR